ncbi:MAG: hypothetical protein ISR95_00995 [Candidatus Marinimicrobia bacterium]|nr:hypothetical protein [Candidatus Neomarinimicrobiota bacterium]MBL7046208.1 hypothetical protein [Candidatus Neomarinimicrobiota bacterium]
MDNLKIASVLLIMVLHSISIVAQTSGITQDSDTTKTEESGNISDIWLNTVWKSIDEITTTEKSFEVEKVTTVAGVRGEEAEDEATKHLYYRGSMRTPSRVELQDALKRLESMITSAPADDRVPELIHYTIQCYLQLGNEKKVYELREELLKNYPYSIWADIYKE